MEWAEELETTLARVASHSRALAPDAGAAATRRLIEALTAKYGMGPDETDNSSQPQEPESAGFTSSDEGVDLPDDDNRDDYWVLLQRFAPAMENERHGPCALEIEAGVIAQAVLDGEWQLPTHASNEELRELVAIGEASRIEMLEGNLRLAHYWAARVSRGDGDLADDLFQSSYFGLYRAIQGWDALRGYAFSTYATWHIRQSIQRARQHSHTGAPVHIPIHVLEEIDSHRRKGMEPQGNARRGLDWMTSTLSLEQIREEVPDLESLTDPDVNEQLEEHLLLVGAAKAALAALEPKGADILIARYGLGDREPETLDAIGLRMGVTRERVRQIEVKAFSVLRMFFAAFEPIKSEVLRQLAAEGDAVAHVAEAALGSNCLTSADVREALHIDADRAKQVTDRITGIVVGLPWSADALPAGNSASVDAKFGPLMSSFAPAPSLRLSY